MFHKVAHQLVEHTDGFSVGVRDRETLVYKDALGEVTIYKDEGPREIGVFSKTMKRVNANGREAAMTPEEKSLILHRIVAGWGALSERPAVVED